MSFAYLPLFTGDYIRDTQHLSCSEHGIFLKLLMHCWDQKGPAPLDERKLCGIVNARSSDEIEALRRVLGEFFVRMEDGHYNTRMQKEIDRSEALSTVRSDAGRRGANERMQRFRNAQASAKQVPSKCQASDATPIPIPILSSDQEEIVPSVLVAKGDAYRAPNFPLQAVLDAYHELCPSMPRIRVMTNMRQKHARARWVEVCVKDKANEDEALDFFRWYFKRAESSDFLSGRRGGNGRVWRADFEWLMTAGNFAKVIEGNYHEARA